MVYKTKSKIITKQVFYKKINLVKVRQDKISYIFYLIILSNKSDLVIHLRHLW